MKYNHQRLLWKMLKDDVSQLKIVEYFKGEGYTEEDVIREINDYEQQQSASAAMKTLPEEDTPVQNPPIQLSKKTAALPTKILMIFMVLLMIILLTVVFEFLLR